MVTAFGNKGSDSNTRRSSRSVKLAVVAGFVALTASGLLALVGAEAWVRLYSPYGYVTPEVLLSRRPEYSPAVFARHVFPRKERRVVDRNGELIYSINALGYRGPAFTPGKPAGTIRIMIYGGSSVFDHDNPRNHDWPHRVETRLQESGFPSVEVINAGIPGHASYDSVGRLFAEGHLFDPDYVLFYGQWNDIKEFRETEPLLRSRLPISQADSDNPLFTYQNALDRWLCEQSQLYVRLRERYYTWNFQIGPQGIIPAGDYVSALSEQTLRQYRMNVQTFVDVARNAGAVPVLVTEGRLVSKGNTAAEKERIDYEYVLMSHDTLVEAFDVMDRSLSEVSREKQVDLIDASRVLSGNNDLFLDANHLTDRGASELADVVATSLAKLLENSPGRCPDCPARSTRTENSSLAPLESTR